ncbi:recombinase family protein [Roseiterribacter gracilis]
MTEKPLAISYIRFSSSAQAAGDSERRQLALAERWCQENGYRLDETLKDLGRSAFRGDNVKEGALGRFLAAITQGTVRPGSILLIESLDRLSRMPPYDAVAVIQQIVNHGVEIITLFDRVRYSVDLLRKDSSLLQRLIGKLERGHDESKVKSDRLAETWDGKRATISLKPMTSISPAWIEFDRTVGEFRLIPTAAAVVERIYAMSIGGIGPRKIARVFNQEGVPPIARKQGWGETYVKKILGNRQVVGFFQPHKKVNGVRVPVGEEVADYYPPVIDLVTFINEADARASRRNKPGQKGERFSNLFRGLGVCASCGSPIYRQNKGRSSPGTGDLAYAVCSNHIRGEHCDDPPRFPFDKLETYTVVLALQFIGEADHAVAMHRRASALASGRAAEKAAKRGALLHEFASRKVSPPDILKLVGDLAEEEAALREEATAHALAAAKAGGPRKFDVIEAWKRARELETATIDERLAFAAELNRLLTCIKVGPGEIELFRSDGKSLGVAHVTKDRLWSPPSRRSVAG